MVIGTDILEDVRDIGDDDNEGGLELGVVGLVVCVLFCSEASGLAPSVALVCDLGLGVDGFDVISRRYFGFTFPLLL